MLYTLLPASRYKFCSDEDVHSFDNMPNCADHHTDHSKASIVFSYRSTILFVKYDLGRRNLFSKNVLYKLIVIHSAIICGLRPCLFNVIHCTGQSYMEVVV